MTTVIKKVDWQQILQTLAIVGSLLVMAWSVERRITVVEEQHRYMIQLLERQQTIIERLQDQEHSREHGR